MTRLYNDPAHFREDMVDGFVAAYERYVRRVPGASGVMRASAPAPGKVSVVVGGGGGQFPAVCGVGPPRPADWGGGGGGGGGGLRRRGGGGGPRAPPPRR
jgi:hypothetical protein